jgi:hypothetical protein
MVGAETKAGGWLLTSVHPYETKGLTSIVDTRTFALAFSAPPPPTFGFGTSISFAAATTAIYALPP